MYEAKTHLSILYILYVGNLSTKIFARHPPNKTKAAVQPMF